MPLKSGDPKDLSGTLIALLEVCSLEPDWWASKLDELSQIHGDQTYRQFLYLLTHLEFGPKEAKLHWDALLENWEHLASGIEEPIDLRVVVLHYFLQVQKEFENPTMVEIRIFQKAQDSALKDELTQTYNYRYFQDRIRQEFERIRRYGQSLSLLMIDVDDFKIFNDRNGHLAGNVALKSVADIIRSSVRDVDIVSRYGGEEFAVLLPATAKSGALTVAEKLRVSVADAKLAGGESLPKGQVTISLGVGAAPIDAETVESLIERADAGLYQAKAAGKNRVEVYSEERREHERLDTTVKGKLRVLDKTASEFTTINLSEGGLLVRSDTPLPLGSIVQVELELREDGDALPCTGRVVRLEEHDQDYEVGLRILHVEPMDLYRYRQFLNELEDPERELEASITGNDPFTPTE